MSPGPALLVRRDFLGKSLHLCHDRPEQFAKFQWDRGSSTICATVYLVYRWLLALFLTSALVISIVGRRILGIPGAAVGGHRAKWPIYITNLSFLCLTAQAVLAATLATRHHLCLGTPVQAMTRLHKTYWVLNNLSNALAPVISMGYWLTVYDPKIHTVDVLNVFDHIVNTVVVMVDLFVVANPIRLLHAYQPILLVAFYSVFTMVYYFAGGTDYNMQHRIYPLLDWSTPHWAVAATLGAMILLIISHILFWLLYLLRKKMALWLVGVERKMQVRPHGNGKVAIKVESV